MIRTPAAEAEYQAAAERERWREKRAAEAERQEAERQEAERQEAAEREREAAERRAQWAAEAERREAEKRERREAELRERVQRLSGVRAALLAAADQGVEAEIAPGDILDLQVHIREPIGAVQRVIDAGAQSPMLISAETAALLAALLEPAALEPGPRRAAAAREAEAGGRNQG